MAEYRLFFLGSDGAIEARQDFIAPDDDSALQIMVAIGKASADSHHGVMLWQGSRRIFEIDDTNKSDGAAILGSKGDGDGVNKRNGDGILGGLTAAVLAAETQQRVIDCEEALLSSHWRLAKSRSLLQATARFRDEVAALKSSPKI
jgi:hypothetical protein